MTETVTPIFTLGSARNGTAGATGLLRRGKGRCRLKASDDAAVRQGWYCPAFETRVRNDVLVLGQRTSLPARLSYGLEHGLNHR